MINLSGANSRGGIYINSSEENINVTGGTVNIDVTNGNNATITSKAPFFNLNVLESGTSSAGVLVANGNSGTGGGQTAITLDKFEILNDLRIDNTGGNGTTFNAGGIGLEITGSLTIDNGANVDFSNMNLTFDGLGSSNLNIGLASTLVLDSLEINKADEFSNLNITNGQATAIQIDDYLNLVRGNLGLANFNVTMNGNLNLADTIGSPSAVGQLYMNGAAAQTITSANGAIFDLEIDNTNGVSLNGDMGILDNFVLDNGIFDIGTFKLTLNKEVATNNGSGFSSSLMVQTAGNSSDGGIEYYFDGMVADPAAILFPLGTNANAVIRYTPTSMDLSGIVDDGYVQVRMSDTELQTVDVAALSSNLLTYYWRVSHRNFGTLPTVASYTFTAVDSDDPDGGAPAGLPVSFVPGKVLDGSPFTRSQENPGDISGLDLTFNGTGAGFTLENANYTAGDGSVTLFAGSPDVYYTTLTGWIDWTDESKWSLTDDGVDDGATGFPQVGDVAVIKSYGNGNGNHWVDANTDINVAEVVFDHAQGGWVPRIRVTDRTANLDLGPVSGRGQFQLQVRTGEVPSFTGNTDLGAFSANTGSQFNFTIDSDNQIVDMPSNITVYPQLRIEAGNGVNDDDNRVLQTSVPITVNSFLQLDRSPRFRINHDVTVAGDTRITWQENRCTIEIGDDRQVTFDIGGDLRMSDGTGDDAARLVVQNDDQMGYEHTIIVRGDIFFEPGLAATSAFDLYNGTGTNNNAILQLSGDGDFSLTNNASGVVTPELYRVVMNAGSDTTRSFTFNNNFTLSGDNTGSTPALELQNGRLVLNDPGLNIELANGVDYTIPGTAGLVVSQGTITTASSNMILSGLLRVNGGTVQLASSDIEYSTSGTALIHVTSGTLNVGGQVRRSTTSTAGVLKYRQTGGDVDIATDGALTISRAAFEVLNAGSEFTLTGGSFNIEQGVTGDANESLELDPETFNLIGSTITIFDGLGMNYGANFFNISSAIPLNNLTVAGLTDLPDVQLFTRDLTVNDLTINADQTLLAGNFNLTINGDLTNAGTYTNTGTETIFAGSGAQSISGAGTFTIHTLRKNGAGTTTASRSLDITNDFFLTAGTFDVGANALRLQNDAYILSTFANTGGEGLVFNGVANQDLNGLANTVVNIGTITISNPSGVDITDGNGYDFNITQELRLNGGVFNVGGSLVTMKPGAPITDVSPFNVNNMVQTNSSFTDNGLRIEFNTVMADTTIFFPIGELKYTPVQFELNAGTTSGAIRVRPANEAHPTIVNDTEPMTEPSIDDQQNVLDYHWIVVAETLTNASGSAVFFYDHDDIRVTVPYDTTHYISARLLSNDVNWDKFAPTEFKGGNQTFAVPLSSFSAAEITGDYTAGVGSSDGINNDIEGAIPNELAQYESVISGSGNYSTAINWNPVGGAPPVTNGVGPVGAQVTVMSGDEVTLDISDVRLFSTEIQAGGTLVIPSGVTGVRLGKVTGSGTIVLQDNELLPTGEYTDFLACDGGGLQYSGTTNYSVLSGISQIRKVIFDGTGTRDMPNNALSVCDTLIINGPTVAFDAGVTYAIGDADTDLFQIQAGTVSASNGAQLDVSGDFLISGGAFSGLPGTTLSITDDLAYVAGTLNWNGMNITLDGTTEQLLNGDFTSTRAFDNLTINNTSLPGVTINTGAVEIDGMLTLTDGMVNTSGTQTLTLTASGDWTGASPASYITGPITKNNLAATSNYTFPVGKPTRYARITVANIGTGGQDWTAEYFTSLGAFPGSSFDDSDPGSGFNPLFAIESSDRWEVTSSGSNLAQLEVAYGSHNGHSDESSLRLVAWDDVDAQWENEGGQIAGDVSGGTVMSENMVHFSTRQVSIGRAPATTVPVELLSFTGVAERGDVVLSWITVSEVNNDRFEVEWSSDGVSFIQIGEVKGNGTTDETQYYSWVDDEPITGLNYYRFRQVDLDGRFEYSPIIYVALEEQSEQVGMRIFPNPITGDRFNLEMTGFRDREILRVSIVNLSGQVIHSQEMNAWQGIDEVTLPQGTPPGIYSIIYQYRHKAALDKVMIRP